MQRYVGWDEDFRLQESLKKYVSAGYKRTEILSFVSIDFPQYPWGYVVLTDVSVILVSTISIITLMLRTFNKLLLRS